MTRSNKLAGWHKDFGWRWVAVSVTVTIQYNICYLEGTVEESLNLAGVVHESQNIEGTIEESQDIVGKIGCGEKL